MLHCKVTCYFREIESKSLSGELFKGAEVLSDVGCGGVGGRGGLLGNTRQSQNPGKGRPGFYILAFPPTLSIPGTQWRENFTEISFKCYFYKFSRFSNFKGQLQAALAASREF